MNTLDFCVNELQKRGLHKDSNRFEICFEKSSNLSIVVEEGKVDHLHRSTDQGLAIRTIRDGKLGFSYTFDLSEDAIKRAIDTALEVGNIMEADENNLLKTYDGYSYPSVNTYDEAGINLPIEEKIAIAMKLEKDLYAEDKRIVRTRSSGFDQSWGESTLIDSNGKRISKSASYFSSYITCVAEQNGREEMGSDARYANYFNKLEYNLVPKEAASDAIELLGSVRAKSAVCPAVFKNSVVASLIGFLSGSFSGESVDKHYSLLAGKLGKNVFSDLITIVDDPLLADGIASTPFDADGTPSQTLMLIENGRLVTYLFDLYYAKKMHAQSTGSARRGSLKTPPSIGTSNLYLKKGERSFDQLLSDAGNGIYITQVLGLHTANPVTGDFSLGASGILIENGKLTQPVKGFAIAGNLLDLMKSVQAVGSDFRFFGSVGAPSLMFREISVGGG